MEHCFHSLPEEKKCIFKELEYTTNKLVNPASDNRVLELTEWKGYRFIPILEAETAKRVYDMKVEENTVFCCSFPRTGSNWTAEILKQILYGEDEKLYALSKSLPVALLYLSLGNPAKVDLLEHIALPRKLFFTHLPEELLNFEKIKRSKAKVIVLARNPKDQAVSWFKFCANEFLDPMRHELSPDWSQFFSDYVQGKHRVVSKLGEGYLEYIRDWHKHKDEDNVLFLHFENMKKNPKGEIARLADFLDVKLTDDRVAEIAEATSFENMKESQGKGGGDLSKVQGALNLIRKGQFGAWKEHLTVAQSEWIDRLVEEKLGHLDFKFIYE